jgi:hypothetical protein
MPGTPRKLKRGPRHAVRALHFATAVLFSRRAKAGWVLFWNYGDRNYRNYGDSALNFQLQLVHCHRNSTFD